MKKRLTTALLFFLSQVSYATGPFAAKVELVQATSISNPFNTVYLDFDITDSPCESTNTHNRFTSANEVQYSMALAALLSNKIIQIFGTGQCVNDIEQINNMRIFPD